MVQLGIILDAQNGDMKTGWIYVDNTWYYLRSSGAMVTGWFQVNGKWYYAYSSGAGCELLL